MRDDNILLAFHYLKNSNILSYMSLKANHYFIVVSIKENQDSFQFLVFIKNFSLFFQHFVLKATYLLRLLFQKNTNINCKYIKYAHIILMTLTSEFKLNYHILLTNVFTI